MDSQQWGRRIRAFRKLKGYTQAEFARELGISLSRLGDIERENRMPSEKLIEKVSEKLGVTIEEMKHL